MEGFKDQGSNSYHVLWGVQAERDESEFVMISGCEVSIVKTRPDIDRHVANRGLQHPQGISLDMCPASNALAPLSCERPTIEKRQANSAEALGSNHMGSRHCRSLKGNL